MELILISDSKLKVMLDADDMHRYAIQCDSMDYDNTETRRVIWQILDEAKQETGFDAAAGRILIQVYPTKEGGCELYVTKLLLPVPAPTLSPAVRETPTLPTVEFPREKGEVCLYEFACFADLLAACHVLHGRGYAGNSTVYADGVRLFLETDEPPRPALFTPGLQAGLLVEFGRPMAETESAYIRERAERLIEGDAVARLAPLS